MLPLPSPTGDPDWEETRAEECPYAPTIRTRMAGHGERAGLQLLFQLGETAALHLQSWLLKIVAVPVYLRVIFCT